MKLDLVFRLRSPTDQSTNVVTTAFEKRDQGSAHDARRAADKDAKGASGSGVDREISSQDTVAVAEGGRKPSRCDGRPEEIAERT